MLFSVAKPVWAKGLQDEKHINLGFFTKIKKPEKYAVAKIAVSGYYRIFVNGKFVCYGPVRCADKHFRVDEIPLDEYLTEGENSIAVETVNYFIPNFAAIRQSGFIQAEIETDGNVVAYTDETGGGFESFLLSSRIRRMQLYSRQRTVVEGYRLYEGVDSWRVGKQTDSAKPVALQETAKKTLLPRELPLNTFESVYPDSVVSCGKVSINSEKPLDKSHFFVADDLMGNSRGFEFSDLEVKLSDDIARFEFEKNSETDCEIKNINLGSGEYKLLTLPTERTGFIAAHLECKSKTKLYFTFDEILNEEGLIDPFRMICVNAVYFEVEAGSYDIMCMEPVGFKYVNLISIGGEIAVNNFRLVEYVNPKSNKATLVGGTEIEQKIFDAGWQTFRQNTSDIFMDCPTRERAGWLCDSFFTGRAETFFTGDNTMERQFLENFILPEPDQHLPKGMLNMCYPSDHCNGSYIVSWAMWYVAELEDYIKRTGDMDIKNRAKKIVYDLLGFLKLRENGDGLLEKLPGWVFVEWSEANRFIQDINYPTNMVYSYILRAVGRMYDDENARERGEKLRDTILAKSYNGEFFVDNAVYCDGKAVSTGETSETCQYHAFFFDIVTPKSHPKLWEKLTVEFGPEREKLGLYPSVYPSNAFTGNLLRLDTLLKYGMFDMCRKEIVGYYADMADITGTLWENMKSTASCNHGFASYVAVLLSNSIAKTVPDYMKQE